jgi:hypothetical protein
MSKFVLRENLRPGDLIDLINPLIEIDRYSPKLGEDKDTVVICFKAETADSAVDLGAYLEWSTKAIQDVEVSDAADKEGRYHVYIELTRLPGLSEKIMNIVEDCEHITSKQEWKFVGMDGQRRDLTMANLNYYVIQDPKIYALPPESREYYQRMRELTKY